MLCGRSFYNLKMYPYKYQLELIKQYEESNEQAILQLVYEQSLGHGVTVEWNLSGPYMNPTTFYSAMGQ